VKRPCSRKYARRLRQNAFDELQTHPEVYEPFLLNAEDRLILAREGSYQGYGEY
jgi:hypothetical protein